MTSSPNDQSGFDVRLGWGRDGLRALGNAAGAVVVVDVLSFTTSVDVAVEAGATVYPYGGPPAGAKAYASRMGAVLVGPRTAGGDGWSLSPASLRSVHKGTRLVMRSLNGSALSAAAAEIAPVVVAGCLRNASAVGAALRRCERPVSVIAAGERWVDGAGLRFAIEDLTGSGAIIAALGWPSSSPEARSAVATYETARSSLWEWLRDCSSGRELIADGFAPDVELAAEHDSSSAVPILMDGAFGDARAV